MSEHSDSTDQTAAATDAGSDLQAAADSQTTLGLESGLDALRESPAFRGPVETRDHYCNDHLALIYESRDQQFAATLPFIEQGLARNERCMYVISDNSEAEVLSAMRTNMDVDVDAALESGALTVHTPEETYLKGGTFRPDEMLDIYTASIEEATDEYEALRITAETSWIMDDGVNLEDFMAYESRVNDLFDGEDCIAICQYDRTSLPPEIIRDIVRTHPHLIYDSTVCHNYYYTPPEEYFGPEQPCREVNRMLETLRERTQATVDLRDREQQLRHQNNRLESFASMLAHELRNPLQIAQIYLHQAADGDSKAVAEVERALDRIEEMIDVLLITARTTDTDIDRERVELADVAAEVWEDVSVDDADLVVETDSVLAADAVHLWHLLENLFRNAVEHGSTSNQPAADDAVEHAGEDVTVRIGDLEDGDGIYVEDDGPGIPDGEREAAFEPGYTTDADGVGLGLTFVAQLAAAYEWECTVTEGSDGGARFEFRNVERFAASD